jgi:thioesterase domain-containing protein
MMIREFLEHLDAQDIRVSAVGDRLRCSAPKGAVTPEVHRELEERKFEILAFLRAGSTAGSSLVPIQSKGIRPPFFAVPGHNGDVFCFVWLAHSLGNDQPFYGLQPPGFDGEQESYENVPDLAAHYVREITSLFPNGPYNVGGYCAGGAVAFEVAQQLVRHGAEVNVLALFDAPFPLAYRTRKKVISIARYVLDRIPHYLRTWMDLDSRQKARFLRDKIGRLVQLFSESGAFATQPGNDFKARVASATTRALKTYSPTSFPGHIDLFLASEESLKQNYSLQRRWQSCASGGLDLHIGVNGCTGTTMLQEPYVEFFAEVLRRCLDRPRRQQVCSVVPKPDKLNPLPTKEQPQTVSSQ